MKKSTDELLKSLHNTRLETYWEENRAELAEVALPELLEALLREKQLNKAEVIARANLFAVYGYQIFQGKRTPSRDKLLALCFGMKLSLDETQTLLKHSGYAALYPRKRRDSAIISALEGNLSLLECNLRLDELNLSPL